MLAHLVVSYDQWSHPFQWFKEVTTHVQFYFIRHAQSENNLLWQRTGSSKERSEDPGLTAVGRQQAHLLAQYLRGPDPPMATQGRNPQNVAGFGLTHLYSSLMVRAVATGTIIARVLGLPLVAWEEAHESGGLRAALMAAVGAATRRSVELGATS